MSKRFLRHCLTLCFFLPLVFLSPDVHAQGYSFSASSGTFTALTGATAIDAIEDDDELSASIPIGFSFTYFGTAYTQLAVSSNGFLALNPNQLSNANSNSIANGTLSRAIAPLWDDLDGTGGTASYVLTGAVGSRVLTVEWLNWQWDYTATAGISFQVKLYEGTNRIEFVYRQEAGPLISPDASIGLVGSTESAFYSLSDASASPSLDINGNDLISSKPASNQVYAFVPNSTAILAPTTAASAITAAPLGSVTATFSWVNGNGAYRAVFVKQTSGTDFYTPTDGTRYAPSTLMGSGSGWYCVYNGTGNSVAVTNLQSTLAYRVQVVEYNGQSGLQKYNTAQVAANFTTLLAAPVGPVSTLTSYHVSSSQITVELTKGNGLSRAIFVKAATTGTAPVIDNTTYTANATFGTGSQIGSSGWYCVFNGADFGNSDYLTVKGLAANTAYRLHVVDYNGTSASEKYYVSSVTGNPIQVSTLVSTPPLLPTYTFAATAGTFTPLTGATAVDAIEGDESLSGAIPIGFPFKMGDNQFTQLIASSNGFLTFSSYTSIFGSNSTNDLEGLNRPLIAPLWDDLSGSGGQASYITSGVSPNRVFTFEFLNWKWYWSASAAGISFQVKLYEANSKIEFIYRPEVGALSSPGASVGLSLPNFSTDNQVPSFLSLNGLSANPTVSSTTETASISAKPVSGQTYSFTPAKAEQTITFTALASKSIGDLPFSLTGTASSGLAVSYNSSNTAVATISGSTVTIIGPGTTNITASQIGNASYNSATNVIQPLIVKDNQTITFTAIPVKTLGDAPFALSATSTSALTVTFSTTSDKVTISGSQVTLVKAGSVTIKADQAGNANYNAATFVERTFCVNPAKPVVTLSGLDTETPVLTSSTTTGNQWYKEGVAISGSTGTTFSPTTPGIYTVISTVDNCSSVSSEQQAIIVTGVEDISKLITVFPNPAQKEVTIDLTSLGKEVSADVAIFDLAGRVFHSSSGKGKMTVNIASYDKGNYLVRVKAGSRIVTKQIAKN